jgi:hypothetical protein
MEDNSLRLFEKRVIRRLFGPKTEEVIGRCRKLHKGGFHEGHCSANIITMITTSRMRLTGTVACVGENANTRVFSRNPRRKWPSRKASVLLGILKRIFGSLRNRIGSEELTHVRGDGAIAGLLWTW